MLPRPNLLKTSTPASSPLSNYFFTQRLKATPFFAVHESDHPENKLFLFFAVSEVVRLTAEFNWFSLVLKKEKQFYPSSLRLCSEQIYFLN